MSRHLSPRKLDVPVPCPGCPAKFYVNFRVMECVIALTVRYKWPAKWSIHFRKALSNFEGVLKCVILCICIMYLVFLNIIRISMFRSDIVRHKNVGDYNSLISFHTYFLAVTKCCMIHNRCCRNPLLTSTDYQRIAEMRIFANIMRRYYLDDISSLECHQIIYGRSFGRN